MDKFLLTKDDIYEFVSANKYPILERHKIHTRCFDGLLEDDSNLEIPVIFGAGAGDISLITSMANSYGIQIDYPKVCEAYTKLYEKPENISFHQHSDKTFFTPDCAHLREIYKDPKDYELSPEDLQTIDALSKDLESEGSHNLSHDTKPVEGAVIFVRGNYGVHPRFDVEFEGKIREINVLVYHLSLAEERYKKISENLIENSAVTLYNGLGEEYLYDALLETQDIHMFETLNRIAEGTPLYEVTFAQDGTFSVESLGNIKGTYEFENQTN